MSGLFSSPGKANSPPVYSGLQVSTSQLDLPVPIFWGQRRMGTNAIDFDDFQKHSQGSKGKGGGGKGGQQYDYTAAVILGLCEGPVDGIVNVWANGSTTTTTTLANLNMSLFTGGATQGPWSWFATRYPSKARSYAYTAYLVCSKLDLGESATVPDNAFEVVRSAGFSYLHTTGGFVNQGTDAPGSILDILLHRWSPGDTGGVSAIDVLLSDVIPDLLTNPQYGGYMDGGDMGALTQFAAYQRAQGLFFSPMLSSQTKVNEALDGWAKLANSWIFWSGTQLEFVPLADSAITGNGVTFTPQNQVAYDLSAADFIAGQNEPPVKVKRKDPADCHNRTTVSITDRTKGYVSNPIEYKDQTLIDQFGQRDADSVQADDICDPAVGTIVAQLIGKREAYIRKTYSFATSSRFIRCLPGTILTLTDPNAGLDHEPVRVTSVKRGDNRHLEFEAEEFPGTVGTYVPSLATVDAATTAFPNFYTPPGNINTPAIVEPDSRFTGGDARIIIAASGGANWGGCTVYLSFDGTSYSAIGTIASAASQGVLTGSLDAYGGVNPDIGHTLSVDCTQSQASLIPVTHDDAAALRSLALVASQPTASGGTMIVPSNGELLAFGALSATGTYSADLAYLERGHYGTAAVAHPPGAQFTALNVLGNDGTSIGYPLPAGYIGKTLYLKFASFNLFDMAPQDLSTVVEYQYTPIGAGYGSGAGGVPAVPSGLAGSDNGADFVLGWNANPVQDNVATYTLWRASGTGASFGAATAIWSGAATRYADPNIADGGAYTYFLTATNAVGQSEASAGVSVTASAPPAPTIQILQLVWAQNAASETAGARVKATVAGPAGTGLTWWIRWKVSGDTHWAEQRLTGLDPAPVTLLTGFVSASDAVDVAASYQPPGGRASGWSTTATISTHPTADSTAATADQVSLRASVR